ASSAADLIVANGVDYVSSFMNQSTFNEADLMNIEDEDDLLTGVDEDDLLTSDHVENLEGQKATFFSDFIDVLNKEKVLTTRQSEGSKQYQNSAKMTTKPIQMKRKGIESKGSALLRDLITQQNAAQQCSLKILELDASCINQIDNASVNEVMTMINRMVNDGLMIKGDKLWCFTMILFENVMKREFFLNMLDDYDKNLMFAMMGEHLNDELGVAHDHDPNNEDLSRVTSNEMKDICNEIATSI
nr:hypothetical protein [Tanacetum cinerariifolium]